MIKKTVAATVAICACAMISGAQAQEKKAHHAFSIQDNSISYEYGSWFHDPFTDKNNNTPANPDSAAMIAKHIIEFNHVDIGNKLGDNVFNVQYLMSNKANPSGDLHDNESNGAKDSYYVYRHDFWLGRLLNKNFSYGPIQDIGIEVGADYGSKNDDWGNQRRSPMAGISVNLKAPNHGFVKVAAMWTREFNEEGTDVTSYLYWDKTTDPYHTTLTTTAPGTCGQYYNFETNPDATDTCIATPATWGVPITYAQEATFQVNWGVPFNVGKAPLMFQGFGTLNSSKGYGGANLTPFYGGYTHAGTKPELLLRPILLYNFGSLFGKGHVWQIGAGYEYWNNMYGVDHHASKSVLMGYDGETPLYLYPSSLENAPFFQITFHL